MLNLFRQMDKEGFAQFEPMQQHENVVVPRLSRAISCPDHPAADKDAKRPCSSSRALRARRTASVTGPLYIVEQMQLIQS